ncbi:hypothetical protein GCM10027062_21780 [Nocardioides hungaricus]
MAILDVRVLQIQFDDAREPRDQVERVAALVAAQEGADLVVLPELWLHGAFAPEHWTQTALSIDGYEISVLAAAARSAGTYLHAGTFIEHSGARGGSGSPSRRMWNTAVLLSRTGEPLCVRLR